jgi:ribonuclease P protein component
MNTERGERFPRSVRIRKRVNYLAVQKKGLKVTSRGFIALVLPREHGPCKLGIIASKRFGGATKRNHIKRLVKEAFRRGLISLPDKIDFVVIPKKIALEFDSKTIFDDLGALGRRTRRLAIESNTL